MVKGRIKMLVKMSKPASNECQSKEPLEYYLLSNGLIDLNFIVIRRLAMAMGFICDHFQD